jgi:hypothetical protein
MTKYHEPMETIVLSVKGLAPGDISDDLKAKLAVELRKAWKAWHDVENCPFDQAEWMLTDAQMLQYKNYLAMSKAQLEAFDAALNADDAAGIIKYGVAIKPPFVEAYKIFGNFSMYLVAAPI